MLYSRNKRNIRFCKQNVYEDYRLSVSRQPTKRANKKGPAISLVVRTWKHASTNEAWRGRLFACFHENGRSKVMQVVLSDCSLAALCRI